MELTSDMARAVSTAWAVAVHTPEPLYGGDESSAFRIGAHVVRVGAPWRSTADIAWCGEVASAAAEEVPEAVAPVPTTDGRTVIRVSGRPVTVWPFVAGEWGDPEDDDQCRRVAHLLARVHRTLSRTKTPPRPRRDVPAAPVPELADAELDAWLAAFRRGRPRRPVHGDVYHANVLARTGRVVALLDWDEATLDAPEWDVSGAAFEWSDTPDTLDISAAMDFVHRYTVAGGPATQLDEVTIRQLIRARIRRETAYDRAVNPTPDAEDVDYQRRRLAAFHALRPDTR
ncbi:phosphotransferase [Spiractinospora alimapuensis]|uniref:phosphotransferase n=1 Tax=Spiractinospora alimapuensis TaxID=2820884 RepID=UPI001F3A147F|nr:phosphotransferase [Spiractinospora alimapuensis]QVQ53805.1 phosphotransferase [Spiractinospora alimapuensis]